MVNQSPVVLVKKKGSAKDSQRRQITQSTNARTSATGNRGEVNIVPTQIGGALVQMAAQGALNNGYNAPL